MNSTQLKYAKGRANDIYRERNDAITKKYKAKCKTISEKDKLKALLKGEVSIKPYKEGAYYQNAWYNYVVFHDEVEFDFASCKKEEEALKNEYQKILDQLVLGDSEEALRLLEQFRSGK